MKAGICDPAFLFVPFEINKDVWEKFSVLVEVVWDFWVNRFRFLSDAGFQMALDQVSYLFEKLRPSSIILTIAKSGIKIASLH